MTRATRRLALTAGLGLALAACATLAARRATPSDEELVRMPHQKHREAGVACETCHSNVAPSTNLDERLLPPERTCLRCHEEWKKSGSCGQCHTGDPQPWPKHVRRVQFSHLDHLPKVKGDCGACHLELAEPGSAQKIAAPMSTCMACHEHQAQYDQARCSPCHSDLTNVPLRPVAYFTHQGDYLKGHRLPARTSPATCAQCHEQRFCADCHARTVATPVEFELPDRVERSFVHGGDFVGRHSLEARADPAMCLRCHAQSSCDQCHQARGASGSSANPRDPHPPGWAGLHGAAARRDIVSCASCHDQGAASNCVACHKVGGIGGSPHPPSFLKSHDHKDIAKLPMCQICH